MVGSAVVVYKVYAKEGAACERWRVNGRMVINPDEKLVVGDKVGTGCTQLTFAKIRRPRYQMAQEI
jgi:hypothetical protein